MSYYIPAAKITANTQEAFEYAIYIIFASRFKKAVLRNQARERALYINYTEISTDLQYEMEEICDAEAEKLSRRLPHDLTEQTVEVAFVRAADGRTELRIFGGNFILRLIGSYRKGEGTVRAEFWKRQTSRSSFGDRG